MTTVIMSQRKNCSSSSENSGPSGEELRSFFSVVAQDSTTDRALDGSQIRQGIASNTKGTAFVVYEDVMDAKQACDKLNGFNFQNRYLVGKC